MQRRKFLGHILQSSAVSLAATTGWLFFPRLALALDPQGAEIENNKTFVFVFLRGAMDGLSMTPPIDDPEYFNLRPNIAIGSKDKKTPLRLKEGFAVHPALTKVHQIVIQNEGGFIFGAGSPCTTRSHFDAQDWFELGEIQFSNSQTGFLGRFATEHYPHLNSGGVVAVQNGFPKILQGYSSAISFPTLKSLHGKNPLTRDKVQEKLGSQNEEVIDPAFFKLYAESKDLLFQAASKSLAIGLPVFARAEDEIQKSEAIIPKGALAKSLAQISALIKTKSGVKIAVTEMGGWDTHVNQGDGEKGSLHDRFAELDDALEFFWNSLEKMKESVTVVVMTEFGRTATENGDRGTDHGHGSTCLVLNTKIKNQIFHQHKSLKKEFLFEGRDIPVTADCRQILCEVLHQQVKGSVISKTLFPGFHWDQSARLFKPT